MRGGGCIGGRYVGVVATLVTVLFAVWGRVGGLKCYECGTLQAGMSTVNPCFGITPESFRECHPTANYCKRYSNEGVIVLACADECKESHSRTTDITCCSTDGCNSGGVAGPCIFLVALAALLTHLLGVAAFTTH